MFWFGLLLTDRPVGAQGARRRCSSASSSRRSSPSSTGVQPCRRRSPRRPTSRTLGQFDLTNVFTVLGAPGGGPDDLQLHAHRLLRHDGHGHGHQRAGRPRRRGRPARERRSHPARRLGRARPSAARPASARTRATSRARPASPKAAAPGFTSVVTGLLFLVAILLTPLAVARARTWRPAPVLIFVGFLMVSLIKDIDFTDIEEGLPALLGADPHAADLQHHRRHRRRRSSRYVVHQGRQRQDHARSIRCCGRSRSRSSSTSGRPGSTRSCRSSASAPSSAAGLRPAPAASAPGDRFLYHRPRCSNGPRCQRGRASSAPGSPAARSVSIAAYVLAGSRLETPARGRRRPLHGAHHVQGHDGATRSTRAISEAIEGVGGSFNAATDRESTVYWVRVPRREADAGDGRPRRADRPAAPRPTTRSRASGPSSSRRSARTSTTRPSTARSCSSTAMFGDGPLGREICGDEAGIRALADGDDPRLLADDVPAGQHGRRRRRRPRPRRGGRARRSTRSGRATGAIPGFAPAPDAARRRARPASGTARHDARPSSCVGVPALRRDHPDAWTLAVLNAVLGDGMSSRLFLSVREELGLAYDVVVRARRLRRRRRARGLGRRRSGRPAGGARRRSSPSSPGSATSRSRTTSSTRRRRYLSGGLELRMDETRHLASWIGGQEALHDRVLTLDEALAAVDAVDAARRPAPGRRAVPRRRPAARGRRAGPATCAASSAACGCRHDDADRAAPRPAPADRRRDGRPRSWPAAPPPRLAGASPGPSSRRWPAAARSTTTGLVDLAEARWRTGDLAGAGEAAAACLEGGRGRSVALVIAAEAQSALGRPERGAPAGRPGDGRGRTAGSTRSSPGCRGRTSGRPTPSSRRRPRRRLFDREPEASARRPAVAATSTADGRRRAPHARPASARAGGSADARALGCASRGDARRRPLPDPASELEAAAPALDAGRPTRPALRFALALRLAPALAPAVLEATEGRPEPASIVVRGDAYGSSATSRGRRRTPSRPGGLPSRPLAHGDAVRQTPAARRRDDGSRGRAAEAPSRQPRRGRRRRRRPPRTDSRPAGRPDPLGTIRYNPASPDPPTPRKTCQEPNAPSSSSSPTASSACSSAASSPATRSAASSSSASSSCRSTATSPSATTPRTARSRSSPASSTSSRRRPLVALALEGPNAIAVVRAINGATRPHEAAPGTIRGDFALETAQNLVHASDSPETGRDRARAVVRPERAARLRARHRPLGARPGRVAQGQLVVRAQRLARPSDGDGDGVTADGGGYGRRRGRRCARRGGCGRAGRRRGRRSDQGRGRYGHRRGRCRRTGRRWRCTRRRALDRLADGRRWATGRTSSIEPADGRRQGDDCEDQRDRGRRERAIAIPGRRPPSGARRPAPVDPMPRPPGVDRLEDAVRPEQADHEQAPVLDERREGRDDEDDRRTAVERQLGELGPGIERGEARATRCWRRRSPRTPRPRIGERRAQPRRSATRRSRTPAAPRHPGGERAAGDDEGEDPGPGRRPRRRVERRQREDARPRRRRRSSSRGCARGRPGPRPRPRPGRSMRSRWPSTIARSGVEVDQERASTDASTQARATTASAAGASAVRIGSAVSGTASRQAGRPEVERDRAEPDRDRDGERQVGQPEDDGLGRSCAEVAAEPGRRGDGQRAGDRRPPGARGCRPWRPPGHARGTSVTARRRGRRPWRRGRRPADRRGPASARWRRGSRG